MHPALRLVASALLELRARLRGVPPIAGRACVRVLVKCHRSRYSSARAERELDVTFRPLRETVADEAAWYRAVGMLPRPSS